MIKYLKYLLKHKWLVFTIGLKLNVPVWQLIKHDWSKFLPSIFRAYTSSLVYGYNYKNWPEEVRNKFDLAFLKHRNWECYHHWQSFIVIHDSGSQKALDIPDRYLREMLADWISAGMAKNGRVDIKDWYNKRKDKILLHPNSRRKLEVLLEQF